MTSTRSRRYSCRRASAATLVSLSLTLAIAADRPALAALPAVPEPAENPITPEKAVLGKILFWDEQLSSDDTVACGTCHEPTAGGAEARGGDHPGFDGVFGTADDVAGSPGIIRSDADNRYVDDPVFGLSPQVTRRSAPSAIGLQWSARIFWDGRADGAFVDPDTQTTSIPSGGALESQSLAPLLSREEMAHEGRTLDDVVAKVERIRPLELADDLPPDVAATLAGGESYPDLFERAFGDRRVTAERIAFAIATYERTLVADQTPWDAYTEGNTAALTFPQIHGMQTFQGTTCVFCHFPPTFSDSSFRVNGVRPVFEDTGRQEVTGLPADRGRFKVPTLRNVGLKKQFMHNGTRTTLNQVVNFYRNGVGQTQFPENQDPFIPQVDVELSEVADLVDFMQNGLTDPRVAAATFPFDRPALSASIDACDDGIDNDGDGLTDFGEDPGCASPGDTAETSIHMACDDGIDNDRDGSTDLDDEFCADPGSPTESIGCEGVTLAFLLPPLLGLGRLRRRAAAARPAD